MKSHGCTAVFLLSMLMQREAAACGQLQSVLVPNILRGHNTHRWPWHAGIYHQYNGTDSTYQCGGTLVGPKFVLTAAHCVYIEAEEISVSLGRLYLDADHESAPFVKVTFLTPIHQSVNTFSDLTHTHTGRRSICAFTLQPGKLR